MRGCYAPLALATAVIAAIATIVDAGCTVQPTNCYEDSVQKRALGNPVNTGRWANAMTLEYCAQLCSDRDLPLAGVGSGTQCMCGNALAAGYNPKSTNCNTPCFDPKEMCGGKDALAVFTFNCSGAPVLAPVPYCSCDALGNWDCSAEKEVKCIRAR